MSVDTCKDLTAVEAYEEVKKVADEVKTFQTWQFPEAASPGDYWRQGDIYIVLLDHPPCEAKKAPPVQQLAEGNTQGSRHELDSLEGVRFFKLEKATALTGPIIQIEAPSRTVTHPEHGHVKLPGEGRTYAITYQRAYAEELRRVAD